MDEVLGQKPEVTAPVVVNTQSGVQVRSTSVTSDNEEPSPAVTPASSRKRNRKRPRSDNESPFAKRHRDNMEFRRQAHEQFMEMMGKLIDKI